MNSRLAQQLVIVAGFVAFTAASSEANPRLAIETANAIKDAKSCQFSWTVKLVQEDAEPLTGRTFVVADAFRWEAMSEDKVVTLSTHGKGKPGLSIDHRSKTYSRTNAAKEYVSPLFQLTELKNVPPEKFEDLGKMRIGTVETRGVRTSLRNLGPSTGAEGTLTVWIDEKSKLPLLVEHEDQLHTNRMESFQWNIPLKPELFAVEPPKDYENQTPTPEKEKEFAQILGALKTYSAAFGHYPQVDKIAGDVISLELRKKLGIPAGFFGQGVVEHKDFPKWMDARWGFGWINVIQNQNSDFKYFGKTVGPNDAGKVLVHWKLEDESYRIIYGDLRTEIVKADRLPSLLKTK